MTCLSKPSQLSVSYSLSKSRCSVQTIQVKDSLQCSLRQLPRHSPYLWNYTFPFKYSAKMSTNSPGVGGGTPLHSSSLSKFECDTSHYKVTSSILGQCCGSLGDVLLAVHVPSQTLVVLKKFNMDKAKDELENIQNEIVLTRQLRHPNVVTLHTAFVWGPDICVVSPLMEYGSCTDLLNRHFVEGLPELAIAYILINILQALDYIHQKGYIHRAVRAKHIFISKTGQAVLSGLRYACRIVRHGRWQRNVYSFPPNMACNLNWLSPEVLEQNFQGYNEKSDVYSLGITVCELANGIVPFADSPATFMLTEKVRGYAPVLMDCTTYTPNYEIERSVDNMLAQQADSGVGDSVGNSNGNDAGLENRSVATRRFSDQFHRFTEVCLQRDPEKRPSASQLLMHSFLKSPKRAGASPLPHLLHPVIPISMEMIAVGEQGDMEVELGDQLSDLDISSYEWDF